MSDKPLAPKSPEFRTLLARFESKLREQLVAAYKARRPLPEVEAEVLAALRHENLTAGLRRSLERQLRVTRREVVKQLGDLFVKERTLRDPAPVVDVIDVALGNYSKLERDMERGLVDVIRQGFTEHLGIEEVENRIASKLGVERHRVSTLARTGMAAVSRATTVYTATDAGIKRFRYAGPSAERDFCRERRGNIYTIEEIERMDNGQGLDVLSHCGGYNCKHSWVAVVKD